MSSTMRKIFLILIFIPILINTQAQVNVRVQAKDTLSISKFYPQTTEGTQFSAKQLVVPGILIAAGIYGTIDTQIDKKIKNQAIKWNGDTFIDEVFTVAAPTSVYVLNWCGVHGKHNFIDRTVILGTSSILAIGSTHLLKQTIDTTRPDGDGNDAFPSRHTALAFAGAEFLRQEFKDQSVWYGVAGYTFATATGFLRVYNNRHWVSDILAGAGIGILATQASYWLYPEIRKLYAGSKLDRAMLVPFGNNRGLGISFSANF